MLRSLLLCAAYTAVFAAPSEKNLRTQWKAFKAKYGRNYVAGPEDDSRFKIFAENKRYIAAHNEKFRQGVVSYRLAMNHFGDMDHDEFVKLYSCGNVSDVPDGGAEFSPPANVNVQKLPKTVDWRKKGYVTPVKYQGQCGSCWAFSATGSLEGQHFKKTGKLVSLSEQNLVDCVKKDYKGHGCPSGSPGSSFKYIKENGGIDTEESYPYVAKRQQQCKFKRANVGANVTGFVKLKKRDEKQLQIAVATVGPISTFIDPHFRALKFYKDGIVDEPNCTTTRLNHVVLLVGYGVKHGKKYWLIKNSYGKHWGNKGYGMIARDKNNMCGIACAASYPLVD